MKIDNRDRLTALDALLNARMAHTQWVAEVVRAEVPCVAEDHRDCAFGKWLLTADTTLGSLPQFVDLIEPHRQLHDAFKTLKGSAEQTYLRARIRELSRTLIDGIDALEKQLHRSGG